MASTIRKFSTGATRDVTAGKPDYEGYISPLVTKRFGQYMLRHQTGPDGEHRASDNWQLGIDRDAYLSSLCRHVEDLRLHHDGFGDEATDQDVESVLCACLFNLQGYLFEALRAKRAGRGGDRPAS
jgi:hypothetical protein